MFIFSFKRFSLVTWLMLLGCTLPVIAQNMEPSLGISFPLKAEGEAVIATKTVLINKQTILPADSILRCCFQMPERNSADVKKKEKKTKLENTFSRKPIKVSSKNEEFDPYKEAVKDRAFKTLWSDPDLFRGYFYKIEPSRYFLVFQKKGASQPSFAKFFFPEGLFLASDGQQIEVLSVQEGSRGQDAGFQAGEKIITLEGLELNGDLQLFVKHYLSVLNKNKLQGKGLVFDVATLDPAENIQRIIRLPLSINSDPFGPIAE